MKRSASGYLDRVFLRFDARAASDRARKNLARQRDDEQRARLNEALALAWKLRDSDSFPIGKLVGTEHEIQVSRTHLSKSGLALGGSGSGKSHWVNSIVNDGFRCFLCSPTTAPEITFLDPKGESYTFLSRLLAAYWVVSSDEGRELLTASVRVLAWRSDRVPPLAPFRKIDPALSDPFIARTRVDIKTETSATGLTMQMRFPLFMLSLLCVELGWPMSPRIMAALFQDESLRRRIAERIRNEQLRHFLENFEQSTSTLVISGLLRRLEEDSSFPQIRASTGMPVEAVDQFLGADTPSIVLADVSASRGIPASIAAEQAAGIVIECLLRIPQRDPRRPLLIVEEELPVITEKVPSVATANAESLRTMRSQNAALLIVTQDYSSALPKSLLEPLSLNARWVAMFRSLAADAGLLSDLPIVPDSDPRGSREGIDRQRGRLVEALPPRHMFFQVRGAGRPLYLSTLDSPEPSVIAGGLAPEVLDEIFDREFARRSLISIAEAERIITRWERSILGGREIPESRDASTPPSAAAGTSSPSGLERLIADLERPRKRPRTS